MKRLGAGGVVLGLLLAGCAAKRPAPPDTVPASLPSPAALESALQGRRDALHSIRALARLRYRDAHEASTSREAIVVARPDRLRVEVLSLFGALFVIAANNGHMTAYSRGENTVYRGEASPENMWHYARIGMPVRDLVDIVLGTPPRSSDRFGTVSYDAGRRAVMLTRTAGDGKLTVWFQSNLPVAAQQSDAWGEVLWQAAFSDYRDNEGLAVATRIHLEVPAWDRSVDIELTDIDVNPALEDSIFELPTPPGARVVNLDRS